MSVSNALQEIKSTHILIQHKHGKNVTLQWDARNQIHALAEPAQARQECQSPIVLQEIKSTYDLNQTKHSKNVSLQWNPRNQTHVRTEPAQAQQESQSPMSCKKS